jgi:hypothetical protein
MARGAVYLCGDGPGSYGYGGHKCQREGCRRHYRVDPAKSPADVGDAITGPCSKKGCGCPGFEDLP